MALVTILADASLSHTPVCARSRLHFVSLCVTLYQSHHPLFAWLPWSWLNWPWRAGRWVAGLCSAFKYTSFKYPSFLAVIGSWRELMLMITYPNDCLTSGLHFTIALTHSFGAIFTFVYQCWMAISYLAKLSLSIYWSRLGLVVVAALLPCHF